MYVASVGGRQDIELCDAEFQFKDDNAADVVYPMAVLATTGSSGLMALGLARQPRHRSGAVRRMTVSRQIYVCARCLSSRAVGVIAGMNDGN